MSFGLSHRALRHKVVERHHFGLDETALEIGMDHSSCFRGGGTHRDRPGAGLLGPCGEVGLQTQRGEPDASQLVQARFILPRGSQQLHGFLRFEFHEFGLQLRVEEDRFGRCHDLRQLRLHVLIGELVGVEVEHIDERLGGQQRQFPKFAGIHPSGEECLPAIEHLAGALSRRQHRRPFLVHAGFLLQPRNRLLQGLQISQDQFGVDRLYVRRGVHRTVDVHHIGIIEHADHLADGVGLADVGQELVAEPLALTGTAHDACDVDETHGGGNLLG